MFFFSIGVSSPVPVHMMVQRERRDSSSTQSDPEGTSHDLSPDRSPGLRCDLNGNHLVSSGYKWLKWGLYNS